MSDKSEKLLMGLTFESPEMDSDQEDLDQMFDHANLVSATTDILDNIGKKDFEFTWQTQFEYIKNQPLTEHIRFAEAILEKVFEIYEYQFPEKIYFVNKKQIEECYDFIKFLEYNNTNFLSIICRVLKIDILKTDIEIYCKKNDMKIIQEVEEQVGIYQQPELISIFLRTNQKEDFIKWFTKQLKQNKLEIAEKLLESEGMK
jgi:hypothetical protein